MNIPAGASGRANGLLSVLSRTDRNRFEAAGEMVELSFGEVLVHPGGGITDAWFPEDAVVSIAIAPAADALALEVALVGFEGMVGVPLVLGAGNTPTLATVVGPGRALRITAKALRAQMQASDAARSVLERYLLVSFTQMTQAALCMRQHRLEQRLARWLLMAADRVRQAPFHATHQFLAAILGVRRAGVTRAAVHLQRLQLIAYHRGDLVVLDRKALEAMACGCYAADQASYSQLMGAA